MGREEAAEWLQSDYKSHIEHVLQCKKTFFSCIPDTYSNFFLLI